MKYILELVLSAIIIFFVWNILKRIFFKTFYGYRFNNNSNQNNRQQDIHGSNKENKQNLKWDAETVDYEEVKQNNDKR
ncbi:MULTISPECIES: hypothetical protein [Chryseobacterium]|jgi:hypothetical protein|uniref:Uncharacterized protein n=1 Tax=Chryseobacterium rhizosphaerae TaxID=395937 RepID=A0AAE4C5G4_9FLAO|nr:MULTISPECIES: hypothetical protein [Chryseobacterium]MBL3549455.1 hypothetical protein [Chryseobacterium sp. KMC2]MDC8101320.1 hypothetical protein [Chryseobacterium rhizosphaerae]MDR6529262.1 hypothetical protein [Chryseobacterium rhizosphaerae]MDR6548387.1 hypothetical protein [Chryseobacterium rhizosphaerae]REC75323.1 hypothetical protein DRF57_11670 [Chryseobacterium rhizosphaerae]